MLLKKSTPATTAMCFFRKGIKHIKLLAFWLTDCLKKYVVLTDTGITKLMLMSRFKQQYDGYSPDYDSFFDLSAGLAELSRFIIENGPHGHLADITNPEKKQPWIYKSDLGPRKQAKRSLALNSSRKRGRGTSDYESDDKDSEASDGEESDSDDFRGAEYAFIPHSTYSANVIDSIKYGNKWLKSKGNQISFGDYVLVSRCSNLYFLIYV